jgi:elongation factor Tu
MPDKPFLLAIDEVHLGLAQGTTVTGRVERGTVKVGEEVEIVGLRPTAKAVVSSIGIENVRKPSEASVGDYVGLELRGVEKSDIERGQVLSKPGTIKPHTKFNGTVPMLSQEEGGGDIPLKNGFRPRFFFRTEEVTGDLYLPEGVETMMPGDTKTISGELVMPFALEVGTRFDIRADVRIQPACRHRVRSPSAQQAGTAVRLHHSPANCE